MRSLEERFWPKVCRTESCWDWTGAKTTAGYGSIMITKAKGQGYAHRLAYEMLVGPIAPGMQLDHLCRNRGCVNPEHLEVVTNLVNAQRGHGGLTPRLRGFCRNGHPIASDEPLRGGGRVCRVCEAKNRAAERVRLRERKAANRD